MPLPILLRAGLACAVLLSLFGCSGSKLVARGAGPLIEHGVMAMNRETDIELARASLPAQLKMIEALLLADPDNGAYRVQAAMGFHGYALGFVEADDPARALALYERAREHAFLALEKDAGLKRAELLGDLTGLDAALARLGADAVPALFWAASAWAKWIELQLDEPARLDELPRVERMMRRVLQLDETYYHGGAHVFFGVYYGGRAPMFGGDFARAETHFARAKALAPGFQWVDVYRARYLLRQRGEREAFHAALTGVRAAPAAADPELNLANALARKQAEALLAQEEELF